MEQVYTHRIPCISSLCEKHFSLTPNRARVTVLNVGVNDIKRKIDYLLTNSDARKWLEKLLEALIPVLAEASEKRMSATVASIILAQVASNIYTGLRLSGKSPDNALSDTIEELKAICSVARDILEENYASGVLEELYAKAIRELQGS